MRRIEVTPPEVAEATRTARSKRRCRTRCVMRVVEGVIVYKVIVTMLLEMIDLTD